MKQAPLPVISQIRKRRLGLGLTQKELALQSGVSLPSIWNLESGANQNPTIGTIEKLHSAIEQAEQAARRRSRKGATAPEVMDLKPEARDRTTSALRPKQSHPSPNALAGRRRTAA